MSHFRKILLKKILRSENKHLRHAHWLYTCTSEVTDLWFTAISCKFSRFPFYFCKKERNVSQTLMWDIMTPLLHSRGILGQMCSAAEIWHDFIFINIQHKFNLHPASLTVLKLAELLFLIIFCDQLFISFLFILHCSHRTGQIYITYNWLTDNCRRKDRKKQKMKRKENYKQDRRNTILPPTQSSPARLLHWNSYKHDSWQSIPWL